MEAFQAHHRLALHTGFLELYSTVSWIECNYRLITFWPIDRLRPVSHSAGNFLIGDVMLGSEDISANLTDATAPIVLDPSGIVLAADFRDFLVDLATGGT